MINKKEKLKEIYILAEKLNISAYKISNKTGISEPGVGKILNKISKNPQQATVDKIYEYLISLVNNHDSCNNSNLEESNTNKISEIYKRNNFKDLPIEEKLNQLNNRLDEMGDVHELLKLMKSKQFAMYDVFTKILKQPAIKEFLNDIMINHEEQTKKIGHKKISKNYFDELINLEENLKG